MTENLPAVCTDPELMDAMRTLFFVCMVLIVGFLIFEWVSYQTEQLRRKEEERRKGGPRN